MKEIYIGNKHHRGKLMQKYYSLRRKYLEQGIIEDRRTLKRKLTDEIGNPENSIDTDTFIDDQIYLKISRDKELIPLTYEKWNCTFELRRRHILDETKDIFDEWPLLTQKVGKDLIELDFEKLYPGKALLLYIKWKTFMEKIIPIYEKEIKDKRCKLLFSELKEVVDEEYKNYLTLLLLPSVLIPSVIKFGKGTEKTVWKPTIADAQNAFAVFVQFSLLTLALWDVLL